MDPFIQKYLDLWGLTKLNTIFNGWSKEQFLQIEESKIPSIISDFYDRIKFKGYYKDLQKKYTESEKLNESYENKVEMKQDAVMAVSLNERKKDGGKMAVIVLEDSQETDEDEPLLDIHHVASDEEENSNYQNSIVSNDDRVLSGTAILLKDILATSCGEEGKKISKRKKLSPRSRNTLCKLLIDYLLIENKGEPITKTQFEYWSRAIVDLFQDESIEAYFVENWKVGDKRGKLQEAYRGKKLRMRHEQTKKPKSKVEGTAEKLKKLLERNADTKELLEKKSIKYLKRSDESSIARLIIKHFIQKNISFRQENYKIWSKAVAAVFHEKLKSKVDYRFFSEILEGELQDYEEIIGRKLVICLQDCQKVSKTPLPKSKSRKLIITLKDVCIDSTAEHHDLALLAKSRYVKQEIASPEKDCTYGYDYNQPPSPKRIKLEPYLSDESTDTDDNLESYLSRYQESTIIDESATICSPSQTETETADERLHVILELYQLCPNQIFVDESNIILVMKELQSRYVKTDYRDYLETLCKLIASLHPSLTHMQVLSKLRRLAHVAKLPHSLNRPQLKAPQRSLLISNAESAIKSKPGPQSSKSSTVKAMQNIAQSSYTSQPIMNQSLSVQQSSTSSQNTGSQASTSKQTVQINSSVLKSMNPHIIPVSKIITSSPSNIITVNNNITITQNPMTASNPKGIKVIPPKELNASPNVVKIISNSTITTMTPSIPSTTTTFRLIASPLKSTNQPRIPPQIQIQNLNQQIQNSISLPQGERPLQAVAPLNSSSIMPQQTIEAVSSLDQDEQKILDILKEADPQSDTVNVFKVPSLIYLMEKMVKMENSDKLCEKLVKLLKRANVNMKSTSCPNYIKALAESCRKQYKEALNESNFLDSIIIKKNFLKNILKLDTRTRNFHRNAKEIDLANVFAIFVYYRRYSLDSQSVEWINAFKIIFPLLNLTEGKKLLMDTITRYDNEVDKTSLLTIIMKHYPDLSHLVGKPNNYELNLQDRTNLIDSIIDYEIRALRIFPSLIHQKQVVFYSHWCEMITRRFYGENHLWYYNSGNKTGFLKTRFEEQLSICNIQNKMKKELNGILNAHHETLYLQTYEENEKLTDTDRTVLVTTLISHLHEKHPTTIIMHHFFQYWEQAIKLFFPSECDISYADKLYEQEALYKAKSNLAKAFLSTIERYDETKYLLEKMSMPLETIDRLIITKIVLKLYTQSNYKQGCLGLWAEVIESLFVMEKADHYHDESTNGGIFYEYLYEMVRTKYDNLTQTQLEDLANRLPMSEPDEMKTLLHVCLLLCLVKSEGKFYNYSSNRFDVKLKIGVVLINYLKAQKILKPKEQEQEKLINDVVSSLYPNESPLIYFNKSSPSILSFCLKSPENLSSSIKDKVIELTSIIKEMPDYNKEVDVLNYIMTSNNNSQSQQIRILEKFSNVFDVHGNTSVASILKDACDVLFVEFDKQYPGRGDMMKQMFINCVPKILASTKACPLIVSIKSSTNNILSDKLHKALFTMPILFFSTGMERRFCLENFILFGLTKSICYNFINKRRLDCLKNNKTFLPLVASYVNGSALKAEVVVDEFRYPCATLIDAVISCIKIYVLMRLKFCSNTGFPFLFILRHCANIIRPEDAEMTDRINEVVKKYFSD